MKAHRAFSKEYKKQVILLYQKRKAENLSNTQIANRLGISLPTLKTIIYPKSA